MSFYDDLDLSLTEARRLIEAGAHDRRSAAHTPVVATLDLDALPSQRIMILRHVDWTGRKLRFHTDARSSKIADADANDSASVLFYLPDDKIQLRFSGIIKVVNEGSEFDDAWDASTPFARRCYMAENAPGLVSSTPVSGLPEWIEGVQPSLEQVGPAKANFALFLFEFHSLEWLYLANSGHRRAKWMWDKTASGWQGSWLVP
jgi:pyridoxamine 5'-phosphate oxidase